MKYIEFDPMTTSTVQLSLQIPETEAGQRLDQALARLLPDYSRSRLKTWIDAGEVLRRRERAGPGTRSTVAKRRRRRHLTEESTAEAAGHPLEMAYEDKHVFIVNKPAGLVVHPGAGNPDRTLQNALLSRDPQLGKLPRAGIVHRLDKDTSGLLIVARTLQAHTALVRMLEAREIHREYEAICRGVMTAGGTVDAPIDRHPTDRVRMAIRDGGPRRGHALPRDPALPRPHARARAARDRAHAPDPRASRARRLSDRR